MRHIFVLLIIFSLEIANCTLGRRLRRQALPSQHIQVHSIDSKVSLDDLITVVSTDSRVELSEKNLNGTIWSDKSKVQFDTYDTFVNATAEVAESIMNILNCVFIHGRALESTLFMTTNRTSDGHTFLNHQMYDNANVSIRDEGVQVQGIGARRVGIEAQTWEQYLEKTMTLSASTNPQSGDRELMLSIVAPQYKIDACFVGAMIYIEFDDKLIEIDPNFTNVNIYTPKYFINFRTKDLNTPYDLKLTNEEIIVRCPQEQTTLVVQPGRVNAHVEEFSKMQLDRGGGEMTLGGNPLHADTVKVISLAALLSLANDGHVRADTTKSEILVQTPVQNVGLTAVHHEIHVFGGVPHLLVEAGMACIEVTASSGMPTSITLLPPFTPPEDRYLTIGPYQALNVTSVPILFPEPYGLNVTQSPLDGCGGQFGVIPKNQTQRPPNNTGTTPTPAIEVTHQIVTYHTLDSQSRTESTTSAYRTPTESVTETDSYSTPDLATQVTPIEEITTVQPPAETTEPQEVLETTENSLTTEETAVTSFPTLITTVEWLSTTETYLTPDDSLLTTVTTEPVTSETITSTQESASSETPAEVETSTVETGTTEEYPFPTNLPIFETTLSEGSTEEMPTPSSFPTLESTTQEVPWSTDIPDAQSLSTTNTAEPTDAIPFPSALPTDDFVIGHWFSTEESGERLTTEAVGIGITATIGSVDIVTNLPVGGPDIPTPAGLDSGDNQPTTESTRETSNFPTPDTLAVDTTPNSDISTVPTIPTVPIGDQKMLILKMRVPEGVDVNSPEFARNVSLSLRRLVRETRKRLKKRVRRETEVILDKNLIGDVNEKTGRNNDDDDEEEDEDGEEEYSDDTENSWMARNTTKRNDKSFDVAQKVNEKYPVKVNGIVKYHNVTQITFSFADFEVTQQELENALYDLETTDLNEYFSFPTTEHISSIKYHYLDSDESKEGEEEYGFFSPLVIGLILTLVIIIVIVPVYFFLKKGETSLILTRMGRHFSKYTAPAHSSTENAFERQSV